MLASEIAKVLDMTVAIEGDEGDAVVRRMTACCIRDLLAVAEAAAALHPEPYTLLSNRNQYEAFDAALAHARSKGWL